jgi:hypothetical protein
MKKRLFPFLCLLYSSAGLFAQGLRINEVIDMRKAGMQQIDANLMGKGYTKKVVSQNKDFTIITYLYSAVENGASVQRSLHLGKRAQRNYGELEYGVWQKQEALDIIDQLTRTGYKKSTSSAPDMGAGNASVSMTFSKGKNSLSYQEKDDGAGHTLYVFSVNTTDYP